LSTPDARGAALDALLATLSRGRFLDEALALACASLPAPRERSLARELAYGTCRFWFRLAAIRDHLLERPLKARDADIGAIIALGIYQLEYLRIPAYAGVAASVELARTRGKRWAGGLVNAVLRRFLRERSACLAAVDRDDTARLAHPQWLLDALARAWPAHREAIAHANNSPGPMSLRVNTRRLTREQALARLADADIAAHALPFARDGLVLHRPRDVAQIPGFADGDFSVQDEAAQLAADLLDAAPGQRLLDACAAPGGKLAHVLERVPDLGAAHAVERDPARVQRLRETVARLGLDARVITGDAGTPQAWWDGRPYDRILLDAPCTATGVIRRHPDIKLLRVACDPQRMAVAQYALLEAVWPLLARGGRLLYATCSVMPEENSGPVKRLLAAHADATAPDLQMACGVPAPPGRQILPGEAGMDGFYYALLAKR
jgi:16S rRNA (cytosine967-C5)-methyltransferase